MCRITARVTRLEKLQDCSMYNGMYMVGKLEAAELPEYKSLAKHTNHNTPQAYPNATLSICDRNVAAEVVCGRA